MVATKNINHTHLLWIALIELQPPKKNNKPRILIFKILAQTEKEECESQLLLKCNQLYAKLYIDF